MLRSNLAVIVFVFPITSICFPKPSSLDSLVLQTCPSYVKKIVCTQQHKAHVIHLKICQFDSPNHACSCISEDSVKNETERLNICIKHKGKRRLQKRQLESSELCTGIQPPKPGKASCTISYGTVSCIGTCDNGFEFSDGSSQLLRSCNKDEGIWTPSAQFPECMPLCEPPCENGGTCTEINLCSCPNDYRGNFCQYPITLCSLSKTTAPSSWQCNHTQFETTCDISCNPPGSHQALTDIKRYSCTMNGLWTPTLPSCIALIHCKEPVAIENGNYQLAVGETFKIGSKIIYYCDTGYLLRGTPNAVCNSNGTWTTGTVECVKESVSFKCNDPGETANSHREVESWNFPVGTTVSYKCNNQYSMIGKSEIYCQPTGHWSEKKPLCIPIKDIPASCSEPNAPKNAVVHVSFPDQQPLKMLLNTNMSLSQKLLLINLGHNYNESSSGLLKGMFVMGTRVQYKCKSRFYKLYGSEYQTCLSSGTWSGYQPACVPDCGKSDTPRTPFIVNGNSSEVGRWPWQVGLAVPGPHGRLEIICGGALVSEELVLTAAHCVTKKYSNAAVEGASIMAYCGKYYRSFENDDEYVQMKRIRQVVVHPDYDFIRYDSDIALLQLDSPVVLTTRVQTICSPTEESTRNNLQDGKDGIVIGWGIKEDGHFSEILRQTTMPVVNHEKCEEAYREGMRSLTVTERMFCAGHASGFSDTCNGDSGGPFMFVGPNNRWFVEGLVSWGSESGCGKVKRYSGFTKVHQFVSWINMFL